MLIFTYAVEVSCEERIPNDDREKYYLLSKQLGVANQLSEYNTSNTSTESIIFGTYVQSNIHINIGMLVYRVTATVQGSK